MMDEAAGGGMGGDMMGRGARGHDTLFPKRGRGRVAGPGHGNRLAILMPMLVQALGWRSVVGFAWEGELFDDFDAVQLARQ